jgi:hypothetical protein
VIDDETNLDAPGAQEGARKLSAAGKNLASAWRTVSAQINSLNAEAPWGHDGNGDKFNEHYLKGGDESPAGMTLKAAGDLIERLERLGPEIKSAVDGTVDADDLTATWFPKGGASKA